MSYSSDVLGGASRCISSSHGHAALLACVTRILMMKNRPSFWFRRRFVYDKLSEIDIYHAYHATLYSAKILQFANINIDRSPTRPPFSPSSPNNTPRFPYSRAREINLNGNETYTKRPYARSQRKLADVWSWYFEYMREHIWCWVNTSWDVCTWLYQKTKTGICTSFQSLKSSSQAAETRCINCSITHKPVKAINQFI